MMAHPLLRLISYVDKDNHQLTLPDIADDSEYIPQEYRLKILETGEIPSKRDARLLGTMGK